MLTVLEAVHPNKKQMWGEASCKEGWAGRVWEEEDVVDEEIVLVYDSVNDFLCPTLKSADLLTIQIHNRRPHAGHMSI